MCTQFCGLVMKFNESTVEQSKFLEKENFYFTKNTDCSQLRRGETNNVIVIAENAT